MQHGPNPNPNPNPNPQAELDTRREELLQAQDQLARAAGLAQHQQGTVLRARRRRALRGAWAAIRQRGKAAPLALAMGRLAAERRLREAARRGLAAWREAPRVAAAALPAT